MKKAELTVVIRQRGNVELIDLLNQIRVENLDESNIDILKPLFTFTTNGNYPRDAFHSFAENASALSHKTAMLHSNINDSNIIQIFNYQSVQTVISYQNMFHEHKLGKPSNETKVKQECQ